jgi:putative sigma-54 modulation protein
MDVTVTFRHTDPIESLKSYAEEKISKIKKYIDVPLEAHIVLSVEKFRHIADVTFSLNGTRIKAVEETDDMYSAIDQVMDKVENQVKKHIGKIRRHRGDGVKAGGKALDEALEESVEMSPDDFSIEVEEMVAKPMDPEEAAMQLMLLSQEFLVFRNAKSREINVIYRKGDGNLGLIEPAG